MFVNECFERFNKITERATKLYPHFHTAEEVIDWMLALAEDELEFFENNGDDACDDHVICKCHGGCECSGESECCKDLDDECYDLECACACHDEPE